MTTNHYKSPSLALKVANESGQAFMLGLACSGPYQFYKGCRAMPSGSRLTGGLHHVRMNTPQTGGSVAAWWAMCTAGQSAAAHLRNKEDRWNMVISGATTSGVLSLRRGLRRMSSDFVMGGVIMGLIEGACHVAQGFVEKQLHKYKNISE